MTFKINSIKIVLIPTILLYVITPISADGISCFKCYASHPGTEETDLLCSHFDGSARFQVYCPSSTLCRKKTIYNRLKTSVRTAVERDCAPQKRTVPIYNDIDKTWQNKEEIVKTAYEEDCFLGEDRGAPGGPSEYCFCSYHLCNSSQSIKATNMYHIFALVMIILFAKLI
ncbi:uncharacterized protein LOC117223485 [Megalopta genalis]|uniref:uncharacterized protein LOC117223485 n=1 Tax=Megalopta genalis TaxID=115081 RepID=UPI0014435D60|nr:uncharacterized protein LOC117223485 [Megalopta genalis]XP_033331658.1 uncharacterized protein LOC117223485 [Megalopta genalis]XP_033331659.1 uncharacterized protein LOC117223485 [Megalopta genalis]